MYKTNVALLQGWSYKAGVTVFGSWHLRGHAALKSWIPHFHKMLIQESMKQTVLCITEINVFLSHKLYSHCQAK